MLTRWWKYSEFKVWVWRKGQPCRCCVRDQTWSLRNCSTRDWVTHNYSCERNKTVQTDIDKDEPHYCGTCCVEMISLFPAPLSISVCWGPDRVAAQSTYAVTLESWETTKWNLCSLSLQFRNSNISHSSSLTPWQLLVNLKYFYTTFIVIRQLLEFVKITDIVSRIPRNWGTEGEWERDQMSRFIAVCLP